jgi:hypothetical protein
MFFRKKYSCEFWGNNNRQLKMFRLFYLLRESFWPLKNAEQADFRCFGHVKNPIQRKSAKICVHQRPKNDPNLYNQTIEKYKTQG